MWLSFALCYSDSFNSLRIITAICSFFLLKNNKLQAPKEKIVIMLTCWQNRLILNNFMVFLGRCFQFFKKTMFFADNDKLSGAEFVVPFFSRSELVIKKGIIKWQLCLFKIKSFHSSVDVFTQPSFWAKKIVIWWLFNDGLRGREREEKTQKFRALQICQEWNRFKTIFS